MNIISSLLKRSNRVILNNNAYKSSEYKDTLKQNSSGIYHKIAIGG